MGGHMASITDRIQVVVGDITTQQVDAIVNSANESLSGGHGVDGAIHRKAGPALFEECRKIGICPEGEARITNGYMLPAKHVIHTVGPVYEGGNFGEAEVLRSCYLSSLALATQCAATTVAFPCIATGVYGYPRGEAAEIAIEAVMSWLAEHAVPDRVIFCCFEELDAVEYRKRLELRHIWLFGSL